MDSRVVSTLALARGARLPAEDWREFTAEQARKILFVDDFSHQRPSRGPEDFDLDDLLNIVEPADLVVIVAGKFDPSRTAIFRTAVENCRWIVFIDTELARADIWIHAAHGCLPNSVPIFSALVPWPDRPSAVAQFQSLVRGEGTVQ